MRLKVEKVHIALLVIITLSLSLQTSYCDKKNATGNVSAITTEKEHANINNIKLQVPLLKINETSTKNEGNKTVASVGGEKTDTKINIPSKDQTSSVQSTKLPPLHTPALDSGAFVRAFYVFLGISVLGVAYLMFRSTRLRKGPPQMVRKYGVLAHKQDLEMRPLPLDEDDEDETTVFDVAGLSSHHSHHSAKA